MGLFKDRRTNGADTNKTEVDVTGVPGGIFARRRLTNAVSSEATVTLDTPPVVPAKMTTLEQYQAALEVHMARLKELKKVEEKAEYKKSALVDFEAFVSEYVDQEHNYPNNVAVEYLIWLFDVDDIAKAVPLALLLIKQGQVAPARFKSSLEVFVCDQVYLYAAAKYKEGQSASPYFMNVFQAMNDDDWDLHEPVGSKMFAMAAKLASLREAWKQVVKYGEEALAMNDGAGVKKLVKEAKAKI